MGQLPPGAISLVETEEDAERFQRPGDAPLAYATQTTLSVDDTAGILKVLKRRFPELPDPHKEDICYATTNRQTRSRCWARVANWFWSWGPRTRPTRPGWSRWPCARAPAPPIWWTTPLRWDWAWFDGVDTVGVTAGASAPEPLIAALVDAIRARFDATVTEDAGARETVTFKLPRLLTA